MSVSDWLHNFVTLFVITDAPGLIPIFLGLTIGMNEKDRQQTALIAAVLSFCIIALFMIGGTALLKAMDISLSAFRVAGGILLFFIAFEMIFGNRTERKKQTVKTAISRDHIRNIAAFPLAMPLIAGPGTLSAAILMTGKHHADFAGMSINILTAALVIAVCYVFMLLATPIEKLIGDTGRSILAKLFGILLSAMAVQFVADGLRALLFH